MDRVPKNMVFGYSKPIQISELKKIVKYGNIFGENEENPRSIYYTTELPEPDNSDLWVPYPSLHHLGSSFFNSLDG